MLDVARLAGVSQQTVSRVVNGHSNVTPDVRQRVEQAIAQLRYRRNSTARSLATRRSMSLGVVSYGLARHGHSMALVGIAESAREHGYATSLVTVAGIGRAEIQSAIDHHVDDSVDGIILLAPVQAAIEAANSLHVDLPLVVFEPNGRPQPHTFAADEALGARLATEHLLNLGHQTVVHLRGPDGWLATQARVQGWWSALSTAGRTIHEPVPTNWDSPSGVYAARRVAELGATAVFAANDQTALGLVHGLNALGLRVPNDVSVVGFDDFPESAYFSPPLTTIRVDFDEIGRIAVEKLLDLLDGKESPHRGLLQPHLLQRGSTAPPPRRPERT